jgi:translation initiation factor IF-2
VPTRIYAFAKELGLDNKALLDICEKANIKGKGSALASLDEAEIATIKEFMAGGSSAAEAPAEPDSGAPVRPRPINTKRKIGEIETPKREVVEEEEVLEQEEVQDEPLVEDAPEQPAEPEQPAAVEPETSEPDSDDEPSQSRSGSSGLHSRLKTGSASDEITPPAPTGPSRTKRPASPLKNRGMSPRRPGVAPPRRQLRNLDDSGKSSSSENKTDKPKKKAGAANIRLAAMPEVKQPNPAANQSGEKVQKPDIALPQDAIKSVKAGGGAAPLEHLTKSKNKKSRKGKGDQTGEVVGEMAGRKSPTRRDRNDMMGSRPSRNRNNNRRYQPSRRRSRSGPVANTAAPRKDDVVLQLPCTIREFSEAAGVPTVKVLLTLKQLGDESNKTINSMVEDEMIELLIEQFDAQVEIREAESLEDTLMAEFEQDIDPEKLEPRAPIVTFLGHVDHGKTSLLDALIGIDVVSGEAGGITQHIRAYEIRKGEQKIAFVDTPGHEAFTEMRARGANVTDIAVLVVAADDGIMPQTEEAISHAKAAGVPIIVALNKIDLPGVTPDKAMQDLASHELLPSEWGGEIEVIKTSAIQGTGLDELLETILVTAELHEYQADPTAPASGTCLEAEQQSDRGVIAKVMIQSGTLNVGDVVVCGASYGKVKAMHDTLRPRKKLKSAEPSTPVNLTGLDVAPGAGDKFYVVDDVAQARELAEQRKHQGRVDMVGGRSVETSLDEFQRLLESGNLKRNSADMVTLNLIIRADVKGSIEAIQKELSKIAHPEVEIKILQALAGGVTVGDIRLAQASNAVVVCFNVVANEDARSLADETGVEIRRYDVIYKITDDLKATLEGRLKPEEQVVESGMAMVLRTFSISKTGTIAGCRVMRGSIQRECRMRVIRDQTVIGDYAIESLKREKDDAKEVARGMECGIKLEKFNDIKEGDTLEAYKIEEIARTL